MARSTAEINNQIVTSLVDNFATIGIVISPSKWSRRNMLRLMCFAFAACAAYIEQMMDALKAEIESTSSRSAAASPLWIQAQMFRFQYSALVPQILQIVDTVPQYPTVDATLRLITGCSVSSNTPNEVTVKVAKQSPFVALSSTERDAAQGYINLIGSAGINYSVVSLDADQIYINANVYYKGQYSSLIATNVKAAIRAFLQNISIVNFDGSLKMSDLETTIRSVEGVNDVELLNVRGRAATTLYSAGIDIIVNQSVILRQWHPVAGYVSEETTSGKTLDASLNFIAE